MYIIAVKDINNNIVKVAYADNENIAENIYNNIRFRYQYPTYMYHNEIQRYAMRSTGGSKRYNGIDNLDISDYIAPTKQPKEFTIQDYKDMIFAIEMQNFISQKDYDLISQYNNKIRELTV